MTILAIPIGVAVATNYVAAGVFAAIGCLNVLLLQFRGTSGDRLRRSGWGLALNTVALAVGTLVGTLGWIEIPLVALGLIVIHGVHRIPREGNLSMVVSVMFVIGVGLPGASVPEAGARAVLALAGG
ncbi:MAG: hypothetical protein WBF81_01185, partial [Thermoplasmata archaeon]